MSDVAYVLLTVVLFAAVAVVARRFGDRAAVPTRVEPSSHVAPAVDGREP